MPITLIQPNSLWTHTKTGKIYIVLMLTNQLSTNPEKFPPTVVYQPVDDASVVWSRSTVDFLKSFTLSGVL